jgi:hypothetical protein
MLIPLLMLTVLFPGCHSKVQIPEELDSNSLLNVISAKSTSRQDLAWAVLSLRRFPVEEKPSFWTTILADKEYGDYHRKKCLAELFRRHIRPGISVMQLGKLVNCSDLFTGECLFDVSMASKLPVRWTGGGSIIMFQPSFARTGQHYLGIYMQMSDRMSTEQFLALMNGHALDDDAVIMEIRISEPSIVEELDLDKLDFPGQGRR